jgi:excinuclease ABC subunit C
VAGLAKRLEEVYLPGSADPVMIPKTSASLKLLQRARDEAHRFAITYHRDRRSKRTLKTELTEIEGVGEVTSQKLLRHFGSAERVKSAALEELQNLAGEKLGKTIFSYYNRETEKQ